MENVTVIGWDVGGSGKGQAFCVWQSDKAKPECCVTLPDGKEIKWLVDVIKNNSRVLIAFDAPFGHPAPFAKVLSHYTKRTKPDKEGQLSDWTWRLADKFVKMKTNEYPLSPTTQQITYFPVIVHRVLSQINNLTTITSSENSLSFETPIAIEVYPRTAKPSKKNFPAEKFWTELVSSSGSDTKEGIEQLWNDIQDIDRINQLEDKGVKKEKLKEKFENNHTGAKTIDQLDAAICAALGLAFMFDTFNVENSLLWHPEDHSGQPEAAEQIRQEGWIYFPRHDKQPDNARA